jgi:uncharacterized protein YuzE
MDQTIVSLVKQALPLLIERPDFTWTYDEQADVLYVTFEREEATNSDLTDDDIVLRYRDDAIIGLTVLHASTRVPAMTAK